MKNYANAKDVLPGELFEEVKKHYAGGMLYVPSGPDREARMKLVLNLLKQNAPPKEVALLSGLGVRRINQIIAQERRKTRSRVAENDEGDGGRAITPKELEDGPEPFKTRLKAFEQEA